MKTKEKYTVPDVVKEKHLDPVEYGQDNRVGQQSVIPLAVKNRHLGTFTFDKATGGTLILGGAGNGNGLLQVKNATGTDIVQLDNTGLHLANGGKVIIDGTGLNSANNFYSDSVTGGAFSTSSSSYVDVTSGALSSLVLTRSTKCFIYMAVNGYNSAFDGWSQTAVYDSYLSTQITNFVCNYHGILDLVWDGAGAITDYAFFNQLSFVGRIFTLAAGTHNMKIQARSNTAGTNNIVGWELGLIQLGD